MATLGLDLGGTNARAAVVSHDGRVLSASKLALKRRDPDAAVEALAEAAAAAIAAAQVPVHGAGIGVAGQLVGETGFVAVAPNLGWRDIPFGTLLNRALGQPVRVVNDLTAAAWGELQAGAGRGARHALVVFVGSGVGSALVIDGRLYTGSTGVAGELGHVKVEPGGRRCGCGGRGCLEAYAGGHNLIAQMKELLAETAGKGEGQGLHDRVGGDPARLNPAILEELALGGDAAARRIYERAAGHLSVAIANQVSVLNPERLILGGGVLNNAPGLVARIEEAVTGWSTEVSARAVRISKAALGDDSGIIGAALLAEPVLQPSKPPSLERTSATEVELLEAELRVFDDFLQQAGQRPVPPPSSVLLSAQHPELFNELTVRYAEALTLSLRREAYRDVAAEPAGVLKAVAERIGHMGGGPRDVVELHAKVLRDRTAGVPPSRAQALMAEGRMVALEMMGHLVAYYRRRAGGSGSGSGRSDG